MQPPACWELQYFSHLIDWGSAMAAGHSRLAWCAMLVLFIVLPSAVPS